MPQAVIQDYPGQANQQPQPEKLRAYLAQDVAWDAAVIPNAPAQPQVDDTPGYKFQGGDDAGSDDHLLP